MSCCAPCRWYLPTAIQPAPWRDGPLFRGCHEAILVDADEHLPVALRYIHLKAVKVRMVTVPQDDLWASHRYYVQASFEESNGHSCCDLFNSENRPRSRSRPATTPRN